MWSRSKVILFLCGGDPRAPLQTTDVQPPQHSTVPSPGPRPYGATEPLVLRGHFAAQSRLRRAGQARQAGAWPILARSRRASTRAAHGDHVAQLEGPSCPKASIQDRLRTSSVLSAMPGRPGEQGPPRRSAGVPACRGGDGRRAGCRHRRGTAAGAYAHLIFYTALFISCRPVLGGSGSERAHAGKGEDDGF